MALSASSQPHTSSASVGLLWLQLLVGVGLPSLSPVRLCETITVLTAL